MGFFVAGGSPVEGPPGSLDGRVECGERRAVFAKENDCQIGDEEEGENCVVCEEVVDPLLYGGMAELVYEEREREGGDTAVGVDYVLVGEPPVDVEEGHDGGVSLCYVEEGDGRVVEG